MAQTWDNCQYSLRNNSFTGKVQATGENASYIGGIIGFYDSLNRIDAISNNYYSKDCGATNGIGFAALPLFGHLHPRWLLLSERR